MSNAQIVSLILEGRESRELVEAIDLLSHAERILVREELGDVSMPRSLWFDYATQEWI